MTKSFALTASLFLLTGCPKKAPEAAAGGETPVAVEATEEALPEAEEPETPEED